MNLQIYTGILNICVYGYSFQVIFHDIFPQIKTLNTTLEWLILGNTDASPNSYFKSAEKFKA